MLARLDSGEQRGKQEGMREGRVAAAAGRPRAEGPVARLDRAADRGKSLGVSVEHACTTSQARAARPRRGAPSRPRPGRRTAPPALRAPPWSRRRCRRGRRRPAGVQRSAAPPRRPARAVRSRPRRTRTAAPRRGRKRVDSGRAAEVRGGRHSTSTSSPGATGRSKSTRGPSQTIALPRSSSQW